LPSPPPSATPKPKITPKSFVSASPENTPSPSSEPYIIQDKSLIDNTASQSQVLALNAKGFVLSENKNKLMWWDDKNQLWVLWLKDQDYQPYMVKGDRELIARLSSPIKNAAWFRDNDHVVVDTGEIGTAGSTFKHVYQIIELDQRGGQNIIKL